MNMLALVDIGESTLSYQTKNPIVSQQLTCAVSRISHTTLLSPEPGGILIDNDLWKFIRVINKIISYS